MDSSGTIHTLPFAMADSFNGNGCDSFGPVAIDGVGSLAWDSKNSLLYLTAYMCGGALGACNVDWDGIASWSPNSNT